MPGSDLSIFATTKNQIQKNETEPQTISIEVMKKIENLDRSLLTKNECEYLDYYLFCFYAGGMPPINASYLEWTNIDEKCILRYNRYTTGKKAEVPCFKKAFDIAEKYSSKCFNHFVLPIYSHKQISEDQKIMKLKRVSIHVNRTLTKVAELIGYDGKITWYSARGTFITYMVKKGYNAFDIAKMCGNSVMAIERSYFKQTDHKNILDEMNASF